MNLLNNAKTKFSFKFVRLSSTKIYSEKNSPKNPQNWENLDDTLLYYQCPLSQPSEKIAGFGFNKCLATTSIFLSGPDGWTLRYNDIVPKLQQLHKEGYRLVMFCNHSPIGRARHPDTKRNAVLQQIGRTGGVVEEINVPMDIFVSTYHPQKRKTGDAPALDSDNFRKPSPGMWKFLVEKCNGGVRADTAKSFYVGGSAGRPKSPTHKNADHSDYDLKFAESCGITFHTDTDYFDLSAKQQGPSLKGNKRGKRSPKQIGEGEEDDSSNETKAKEATKE